MNNWTIALIILWMILALANIAGIWTAIPILSGIFGFLNCTIIVSLIPLLYQEIKQKKAEKKEKKENQDELQLQK